MPWSCVQTYGGAEKKALENLHRQGYKALYPTYTNPQQHRKLPLFPGYLFISLAPQQAWHSINNTYGVVRLLTNRNPIDPKPLYVPDGFINGLNLLSADQSTWHLAPGTLVRIKDKNSPLFDQLGTVASLIGQQRVRVLMSLFNRDIIVEFSNPLANLEVLTEEPVPVPVMMRRRA